MKSDLLIIVIFIVFYSMSFKINLIFLTLQTKILIKNSNIQNYDFTIFLYTLIHNKFPSGSIK